MAYISVAISSPPRQLTTVLSHAEVSGHVRVIKGKESNFGTEEDNVDGMAPVSNLPRKRDSARASRCDDIAPTVPETGPSSSSSTGTSESDGGEDDSGTGQEEETSLEGTNVEGGNEMRGGGVARREWATRTPAGTGGESLMPGVSASRLYCLRGR